MFLFLASWSPVLTVIPLKQALQRVFSNPHSGCLKPICIMVLLFSTALGTALEENDGCLNCDSSTADPVTQMLWMTDEQAGHACSMLH